MPNLFCFFSGFVHQDVEVTTIQRDVEKGLVIVQCQNNGNKLIQENDYIQLQGVLFQVTETYDVYFTASSTVELLEQTTLSQIKIGDKLSLGILAENDRSHSALWMLQPSAARKAVYKGYSVLETHEHTLKLDFEASTECASSIQDNQHLGLDGASLTAREVKLEDMLKFSIYCGRETREKTAFNSDLSIGTEINLTEAAGIFKIV